jgi:hypothetical protein
MEQRRTTRPVFALVARRFAVRGTRLLKAQPVEVFRKPRRAVAGALYRMEPRPPRATAGPAP